MITVQETCKRIDRRRATSGYTSFAEQVHISLVHLLPFPLPFFLQFRCLVPGDRPYDIQHPAE